MKISERNPNQRLESSKNNSHKNRFKPCRSSENKHEYTLQEEHSLK